MPEPCKDTDVSATSASGTMPRVRSRSPASIARIRTKNRRKHYLDLHPDYFSSSLELAGLHPPIVFVYSTVRLISVRSSGLRSPGETLPDARGTRSRGKKKGYSGVLEADLWRSEAKLEALASPATASLMAYTRGSDGEILAEERDEVPQTKEEGMQRWRKKMELRFLRGDDEEFDYSHVDNGEAFDDRGIEEREEEEKWFEAEEAQWASDTHEGKVEGETGVQDF
ncbi:hypothetical protein MMC19_004913 [Ptychographa xylographoides]|nr:hypothetical protein [Ptychographa xylographoides]